MQFNSLEFIFCFFPLFLAFYFIVPQRFRNLILLIGSFCFMLAGSGGSVRWLVPLVIVTCISFLTGFAVRDGRRRWLLVACLGLFTALLCFFKFYQGGKLLPPGMSFYLFQMAAYLMDLHRKKLPVETNLTRYFTQMAMFPKLLSGPLMQPAELQKQVWGRGYFPFLFNRGLQEFILGLGFKVLLADRMGGLWNQAAVIGYKSISVPFAWVALLAYAMRLYFDFYGYSMMAMGLGRMLGFDLPRNFDSPYASKTVSDFYRRWHMTLGRWFRDYIYIPLGGSRRGTVRTIVNLGAVWLFTGFWHGVTPNYLIWAGFLFLLIVNEKLWMGKLMNRSRVISHVYVVFVILLSWLPFAIPDFGSLSVYLGRMFGLTGMTINPRDILLVGKDYAGLLAAGVLFATPLPRKIWEKIRNKSIATPILFVLFWVVVYFIATRSQDPFVYFQY